MLTDCNIRVECKNSTYAHGRHIDTFVIEITITVNATTSFSLAKLRGYLYAPDNTEKTSSERIFPEISEACNTSGELFVNGKAITTLSECHKVINIPVLNIVFLCNSRVFPCLIEITTNDSTEIAKGKGLITWNNDNISQREVNLQIKYDVCVLKGYSPTINCKFILENTLKQEEHIYIDITIIVVTTIALFIGSCLVVLLKLKYKVNVQCPPFFKSKASGNGHSNDIVSLSNLSHSDDFSIKLLEDTQKSDAAAAKNLLDKVMSCENNESHLSFIPMDHFTIENLPQMYQDTDIFNLVQNLAELTVKVTVSYISDQRPNTFLDTVDQNSYNDKSRYTFTTMFGTGFIKSVVKNQEEDVKPCECKKCSQSNKAGKVQGKISISTAKSLIFDDNGAQTTTFEIEYTYKSESYSYNVDLRVIKNQIGDNQCIIECLTCNEGLIFYLFLKLQNFKQQMDVVNSKYFRRKVEDNLTIIVTHPRGCSKHVYIGEWVDGSTRGIDGSKQLLNYVTRTCPCCIGAFVYILGVSGTSLEHRIHCEVNDTLNVFEDVDLENRIKSKETSSKPYPKK